jgi:hypothetical protein
MNELESQIIPVTVDPDGDEKQIECVTAEFARELKRKLAEARECAEVLRNQLEIVGKTYAGGPVTTPPELPWSQPDLSRDALISAVKGGGV